MFAIFVASTGVGPFISTRSFDIYHSYVPAFSFFEVILVVSIVIFSLLGPYPYPATHRHAPGRAREQGRGLTARDPGFRTARRPPSSPVVLHADR